VQAIAELAFTYDPFMTITRVLDAILRVASFRWHQALHRIAAAWNIRIATIGDQVNHLTDLELVLGHENSARKGRQRHPGSSRDALPAVQVRRL
jgi:hypothetical protein